MQVEKHAVKMRSILLVSEPRQEKKKRSIEYILATILKKEGESFQSALITFLQWK